MTTASEPVSDAPTAPPVPVRASFWILIVSAAFRAVVAVLLVALWNSQVDAAMKTVPKGMTPQQWRSEVHTLIILNIILDLFFAALYVLFAYMIRKGRNWARLTLTVIVVVFGLYDLFTTATVITLASVIIELVAVGLLYLQASKDFFAAAKRLS